MVLLCPWNMLGIPSLEKILKVSKSPNCQHLETLVRWIFSLFWVHDHQAQRFRAAVHNNFVLRRPTGCNDPDCWNVCVKVALFFRSSPTIDLCYGSSRVFRAVPSLLVEERLQVITEFSSL